MVEYGAIIGKALSAIKTIVTLGQANSKEKDEQYLSERYPFYSNDPCKNFSTRKQIETFDSIKNKLEEKITEEVRETLEEDMHAYLPYAEHTFLPFTREYLLKTHKKNKPKKIDLFNDFFSNLEYRETFDIKVNHIDATLDNYTTQELRYKEAIHEDTIKDLLENIASDPSTLIGENKSILLLGDIGSGKTTFFSKIMHDMVAANTASSVPYKLPIQIDFEEIILTSERHDTLLEEYMNKIFKKIHNKINQALQEHKSMTKKSSAVRLVVFLDNLDVVYQKFCEDYFISETGHKFLDIFLSIVRNMQKRDFHKESILLFCGLRGESIKALKHRTVGSREELEKLFLMRMEVKQKNNIETKSIIEKRLKLAVDSLKRGTQNKELIDIAEANYNNFKSKCEIDFEELNNISSEGLRNTVDLFYRISPSLYSRSVFSRFFIDKYYIKKLHFLGDNLTFTQADNGVFNIFLNNANYRYSELGNLCTVGSLSDISSQKLCKLSSEKHLHTYWLKYFILLYLYDAKKSSNKQTPSIRDILNFFSPKNTHYTYEENLVRLILLGLSEAKHGKIIDIILTDNGTINTFELSSRGEYLLENIIWNFDYLSVIIEDFWLQFPSEMFRDYEWMFKSEEGYCYITKEKDFEDKRRKNLQYKIKKLKLFLEILEISYRYEKIKIGDIFKELNDRSKRLKEKNYSFSLPDFSDITKNINLQISKYAEICELENINNKSILSFREKMKYRKFFKENYGAMKKDVSSRKKYHQENQESIKELNLSK